MTISSLLRRHEDRALAHLTFEGDVLDIGGDTRSAYRKNCANQSRVTTINLDPSTKPDLMLDLEQPLSGNALEGRFDEVLLINVLEHVYHAQQLLSGAAACARDGGRVTIVVPFMFPVHPSPHDFHRFTHEALERMMHDAGLDSVSVRALGTGVFASCVLSVERLMPAPIRLLSSVVVHPLVGVLDALFTRTARLLGKAYSPHDYALGYIATARKHTHE